MAARPPHMHLLSRLPRRLIIVLCMLVVLAAAGRYLYGQYQRDTVTVIHNSAGTTYPYSVPDSERQHIDLGVFGFDLPRDWKQTAHEYTGPYDRYGYQSTLKNADNRYLDIYADRLPLTMAVNRSVAVRPQGNNLSHGMTSENCTELPAVAAAIRTGRHLVVPAEWDGVPFLCDNDNTTRNVIGTSAPGSVNRITLTGRTQGTHSFYFVYTDNNYTPDYTIFYNMLESFKVN